MTLGGLLLYYGGSSMAGHKNRTRNKYVYAQGDVQWDDEKVNT